MIIPHAHNWEHEVRQCKSLLGFHSTRIQYCRDWVNGDRQGRGKFTYSDGETYEGQWDEDTREGKGKCIYANGEIYEGNCVNG